MNLTALEIKQQTFEKSIRGYDINEVTSFLKLVSREWEDLVGKTKEQENEILRLKDKVRHYEKVEEALNETLQSAKKSAEQRLTGAKIESQSKIQQAELEAERIVSNAHSQRREIRMGIIKLLDRREEMIRGMKTYLDLAGESLDAFSRDEASVFKAPPMEDAPPPPVKEPEAARPVEVSAPAEEKHNGEHHNGENHGKEKQKLKYFSTDPDDMDDLLDEID